MIGKISGVLDHRGTDHVLIEARGVGYIVYVSERTLAQMPAPGQPVALYTDLVVREDLLQLYGFPNVAEKEWHKLLTSVQGVGAKASLAMLGTLGVDGVARAMSLGDVAAIKAAPGVGPKLAQRVIHELRDKAPALMLSLGAQSAEPAMVSGTPETPQVAPAARPDPAEMASPRASPPTAGAVAADALSALANLGYAPAQAAQAVAEAAEEGADDTAALIRAALRRLDSNA
ncbi:MAG: Holliday junction branch migration protein RuvA [Pseudomonadota bacterium]